MTRNKAKNTLQDSNDEPTRFQRHAGGNVVWEWVKAILVAVVLALMIRWPLIEPFKIPSGSMKPTFLEGDRIFVNKWVYGVRYPFNGFRIPFTRIDTWYADSRIWQGAPVERWDIVVFKSIEPRSEHPILVKRVVGLPGERVHIARGEVFVNGSPLEIPDRMPGVVYTNPWGMQYGILEDEEFSIVPEGHYFLLGDNSDQSRDGRVWGWVPNEHILGRVSAIWWPVTRWRDLSGFSNTVAWNIFLFLLALAVFLRLFVGRLWQLMDGGLEPQLRAGEHVLVNRIAFGIPVPFTTMRLTRGKGADRGDIVLCYCEDKEGNRGVVVGRVAGLAGEKVQFDDDRLTINGAPANDPPEFRRLRFAPSSNGGPYGRSKSKEYAVVPEDHYFVLVDNGEESLDSRALGWISRADVVGKVTFVWWPVYRARRARA